MLDYHGTANLAVLRSYGMHVGRVCVTDLTPTNDARDLTLQDCTNHEIEIITTTEEQRTEAASMEGQSGLSVYDVLNLIVARDHGLTIVTNDRPLWKKARSTGVPFLRGLRLLIELAKRGIMRVDVAMSIGRQIVKQNEYMTPRILAEFEHKLRNLNSDEQPHDGPKQRRKSIKKKTPS